MQRIKSATINYFGCLLIPSRYRMVNRTGGRHRPRAMSDSGRIARYTFGGSHTDIIYTVNTLVCSRAVSMTRYQSVDFDVRTIIDINGPR